MKTAALLLLMLSLRCFAQDAAHAEKKFFQLNFVTRELENERVINSRSYSLIMSTEKDRASIRADEHIPFRASATSIESTRYDVGFNVDCAELRDLGDRVSLHVQASLSGIVEEEHSAADAAKLPPVLRSNMWQSDVLIPLKQSVILYSSDDAASKHKMQLQLTVTPVH